MQSAELSLAGCTGTQTRPNIELSDVVLTRQWIRGRTDDIGMLAQIVSPTFSVDQVLSPYVYVFYAAFIVSFLFTPIMRVVANYYGVVDQPDKIRKTHREPVVTCWSWAPMAIVGSGNWCWAESHRTCSVGTRASRSWSRIEWVGVRRQSSYRGSTDPVLKTGVKSHG